MTANEQRDLVALLRATPNGKPVTFPALLPALSKEPMQGIITMRDGDWWELELYWLSVQVGKVTAQVLENRLILETL